MELQLDSITRVVRGQTHLYEMSLALQPGLNVLLGPTTAGKTSLMRVMAGLDHPTTGRVLKDGVDVTHVSVKKRNIAFVYQQFINYPNLTIFENIASPLRIRGGFSKVELTKRVNEAAAMMQIGGLLKRLPSELSGGQLQRTAIARALIKETDLLFMDEPLVNLDYKLREELRIEMRNIFSKREAIVVYSTTEPLEALMLGGTVFVLDAGRLLQTGPTLDVYHRPDNQRVGQIFSDPPMNMLPAKASSGRIQIAGDRQIEAAEHMAGVPDGEYWIGVRANHVAPTPSSDRDLAISANVDLAEISGSETFVHTDGHGRDGSHFRIVSQLEGVHQFDQGQTLTIYMDPARLYLFDADGNLAAAPNRRQPETTLGEGAI